MKRWVLAAGISAALSGCYVVPMGHDHLERMVRATEGQPPQPPSTPPQPVATGPTSVPARLYPVNDVANQSGMVSGTITNFMNGKARFQLTYKGEQLVGEATRVSGDERKGIATAWGPSGSFMTCEYQMSAPVRGAGNCNFSDGARYQVHVGN